MNKNETRAYKLCDKACRLGVEECCDARARSGGDLAPVVQGLMALLDPRVPRRPDPAEPSGASGPRGDFVGTFQGIWRGEARSAYLTYEITLAVGDEESELTSIGPDGPRCASKLELLRFKPPEATMSQRLLPSSSAACIDRGQVSLMDNGQGILGYSWVDPTGSVTLTGQLRRVEP